MRTRINSGLLRSRRTFFHNLLLVVILTFLFALPSLAQAIEDPLRVAGTAGGTGKYFEIRDSEYLNIALESSEEITIQLESSGGMIIIQLDGKGNASVSNLTISGFSPGATYHKYEDDFHNHAPFTADEKGAFLFDQDISQDHIIFIQPRESTKYIRSVDGGDCGSIGNWNSSSKTCVLNQDVSGTIQIDNGNITLEGNGHAVTGSGDGIGIYAKENQTKVRNIRVSGFSHGIYFYRSSGGTVELVSAENNGYGINLAESHSNRVINNTAKSNSEAGIRLGRSSYTNCSNNIAGPGNIVGMMQAYGNYNILENNVVFENREGFLIGGTGDRILGNRAESNNYEGIYITGSADVTMKNNHMSGNGINFSWFNNNDLSAIDIDLSNTVEGKPVYFIKNLANKTFDDSANIGAFYCVNCKNINLKNMPLTRGAPQIFFRNTNDSVIDGIVSPDKSAIIEFNSSSRNILKNSDLKKIHIQDSGNNNKIYGNNFSDMAEPAYSCFSCSGNLFNLDLPTGGNFWKKNEASCQDSDKNGFCDSSFVFSGGKDKYPLAKELDFNQPSCCSSVMFLPGHQASRLYKVDAWGSYRLWEPENRNEDVEKLYLDPKTGESVDSEIYTGEIIDEAYDIKNIYKGFIKSMDKFTADGFIKEWKAVPYDWREPLSKIASDGVQRKNGGRLDIVQEIRNMAKTSKTGKVTLIGHSNGGLLAKTLIEKLKETGEEKLVDKLVMVAAPQLGTPKAAASLLHGDETSIMHGLVLNGETGREFAENMESAYNLLPSREYFDTVQSPVAEFDEDVKDIYDFRSLYGNDISNWDEFQKFLLGDEGKRTEPKAGDTDSPNVLKEFLLSRSDSNHNDLDSWQAPEGMEVVQIAGWGLDTIRGIKYDDCDIPFCPDKLSNLDRSLIMTEDGDETVVVPSAVEMERAERYYVNIKEYNKELILNSRINRNHASILEIGPLQDFIKNIIQNNRTLTEHISLEKPEVKNEDKRLRFRLHSPVAVDLYDEDGNHTGLIKNPNPSSDLKLFEEQISNSYYMELGEKKYAGTGNSPVKVVLTGENLGIFTFEIDEVAGSETTNTETFANIPVMKGAKAEISISETIGEMEVDVDGDGEIDGTFGAGEEIKKYDLLSIFEKIIGSLDVDSALRDRLINKIDNAKKQVEKGHSTSANAMLENVKQQIENFSREKTPEKFRISGEDAGKLVGIVERIQAME